MNTVHCIEYHDTNTLHYIQYSLNEAALWLENEWVKRWVERLNCKFLAVGAQWNSCIASANRKQQLVPLQLLNHIPPNLVFLLLTN